MEDRIRNVQGLLLPSRERRTERKTSCDQQLPLLTPAARSAMGRRPQLDGAAENSDPTETCLLLLLRLSY